MSVVAPGSPGTLRSLSSKYRWRRPRMLYPQFEAICACWSKIGIGTEVVLARNTIAEGNMTPYDAGHFRECFRRVANRYGYYAGLQYTTEVRGRDLVMFVVAHEPGFPKMSASEMYGSYTFAMHNPVRRS